MTTYDQADVGVSLISSDLLDSTGPEKVADEWKYAVESYTFGDTALADELGVERPTVGEFGGHLLSFHHRDDEYVASCVLCARRVEVADETTPDQRHAVGMYAIGHFLDHTCDPVDISEVEAFYTGKMSTTNTLNSLKHDLADMLAEEAEVLRYGD